MATPHGVRAVLIAEPLCIALFGGRIASRCPDKRGRPLVRLWRLPVVAKNVGICGGRVPRWTAGTGMAAGEAPDVVLPGRRSRSQTVSKSIFELLFLTVK